MMPNRIKINIDDLNKRQYEIFTDIITSKSKYHVIRSSRQSGKSFLLLRLAIYFIFNSRSEGAIVSASDKQFKKLWNDLLNLVPDELVKDTNRDVNIIYFINGSTLQFFTAGNVDGGLVGSTFDFLICDEVALYPKDALNFITPVLAAKKDGKAIFASTPRGKNDFYDYCMRGMNESDDFVQHYRMSYLDNKYYDLNEVEFKRRTMVESIFKSEYLAEFVFGSSSVFGEFSKYQKILKWIEPNKDDRYFGGIDVAGDGEDSTILTIVNQKGEVCIMYECSSPKLPEQAMEMLPIIKKYNARVKVEKNGLGKGLFDIMEMNDPNVSGFNMTNESKNDLVTRAKLAMYNSDLVLPTADLFPKLDSEMSSYIVKRTATGKLTYSHEDNFNDDSVDSLMLANYVKELHMEGNELSTYGDEDPGIPKTLTPTGRDIMNYENDVDYYG